MAAPIKEYSCGKVKAAVWKGDYEGKPTFSVTFNKSYQKDGKWQNSNYFTQVDLRDLYILVTKMVQSSVKERQPQQQKQEQQYTPEEAVAALEDPFV